MNRNTLIAIAVAAVVVVVLIVVIPSLGGSDNGTQPAGTAPQAAAGDAPPLSPDATMPPDHPDVEGDQGGAAPATGDPAQLKALEDEYKEKPEDTTVMLSLGRAYLDAGRADDAKALFDKVLVIDPKNSEAKVAIAMTDFNAGNAAEAQKALETIAKEDPKSQEALYSLAIVYFSGNDREKAKETWAKVVAIDKDSELGSLAAQFIELMSNPSGGGATGANPHGGAATSPTTTP